MRSVSSKRGHRDAALGYPFRVTPDEGVFFIEFPDLPGCMTQAETAEDIGPMALDAARAWLATARELGRPIPVPSAPASSVA